jgi:hypothetical protein
MQVPECAGGRRHEIRVTKRKLNATLRDVSKSVRDRRLRFYYFLCLSFLTVLLYSHTAFAFDIALEPTVTTSRPADLWLFLPLGYLFTVAIETPVLVFGLSKDISLKERFFAGLWLTACTYPIVVLVLPILFAASRRDRYLLVAEVFAPLAECALFWLAFHNRKQEKPRNLIRNFAVVIVANLLSFGAGEILNSYRWFGLF